MFSNYVFYIYAPQYTPLSSGIRVLYILCDQLNKFGYESYVTSVYNGTEFLAPNITADVIEKHKKLGKRQVAIYPEIMMDNPLQSKYVIRWLLNRPNNFLQNWLGDFPEDEFIVHHDESFKPFWIKSTKQYIPHIDRSIFNTQDCSINRKGVIIYEHRNKIDSEYIKKFDNIQYISSKKPLGPLECANLYKTSAALIVAERTAAFGEAALCGCPTVFLENNKFDANYIFQTYWKISCFKEFTTNINDLNEGNGRRLEKIYDIEVEKERNHLQLLIKKSIDFFDNKLEKPPEDITSILLQNCTNLILVKNYSDALTILEKIFNFTEVPNKAYYLYYKICRDLGNNIEADFAKNYLFEKILSYGDGSYFNKIFDFNNGNFL